MNNIFDFLENVNFYLFDLNQYNRDCTELDITIFANYLGKTYITDNILVNPLSFCDWNGYKWGLKTDDPLATELLKVRGGLEIEKQLNDGELNY